jgi:pSer/pThr/pTyr-binding forkhead associated (FHA) protein
MPGPRKSAQRSNSQSSLTSASSSSSSTISQASTPSQPSPSSQDPTSWTTRKKSSRGIWPSGKAEPTAGLSTTRPQPVSSTSSGPSAASAISALHGPMLPSQQMSTAQNGSLRGAQTPSDTPAILHLSPMNGTFERKTISVPFYPDVLRIGRQTNAKTAPTPANGFFDSKVLSRQHAEIYAERNLNGRIYIRDVKSSNGTFVNGQRLSPENKESEPHELREQDVLELGIDIVSEDQKTIVHHKVAARVEHAGIYNQTAELNFGEMDPSHQMKRSGSQSSQQSAKANAMAAVMAARDSNAMQQPQWSRGWPSTVTTETIVKRLNRELSLAKKQSSDLARSKTCLEGLLAADTKGKQDKSLRSSPLKQHKSDSNPSAILFEPPAPPPQAPLPEKPDVAKALADPAIQPLLMRSETARPILAPNGSPTRADHSQALLILTHELKLAKDQIPSLEDRVRSLEEALKQERNARETAEERASLLESSQKSPEDEEDVSRAEQQNDSAKSDDPPKDETSDLQSQLDRLRAATEDMKTQMEAYRRRAETAESQRDDAHQTLAEMVEQKRKENAELQRQQETPATPPSSFSSPSSITTSSNAQISEPFVEGSLYSLLTEAGINANAALSPEQAASIQRLLARKMPVAQRDATNGSSDNLKEQLAHHGLPLGSGFIVVVVGMALMHYLDGWEKLHR